MKIHYQSSRLFNLEMFREDELDMLHGIAATTPLDSLIKSPRWKEESAIDFVFTSSQIEGNTYSLADTISLLKVGKTANDKRYTEAVMIMNLRAAYDHILENSKDALNDPIRALQTYHSILMHGLLESDVLGQPRKSNGTAIFGSGYIPLSGQERLEKELQTLIECLSKINDPFEKALYASSNLAYLQFFEDGNKRTSRLFQNAVLMANNLPPVLFPISEIKNYIESTIYYYEQGDHILNRAFMMNAYRKAYVANEIERSAQVPNTPT